MSDPGTDGPTSPFKSILDWSLAWPDWQRDALRRIITKGSLGEEDVKELATLCRAKHGLHPEKGEAPTADPLTADHIPGGVHGTASVSLTKVSSLQNVGRLPSDQKIDFGPSPGLTVIYGENGAGKSGYARVIKKACRARGKTQDIRPDAFASHRKGPASATINFRVGEVDTAVTWTDGTPSDPRLSNIFVFDSFSAEAHVRESGPASFTLRGLDVLPELARACDTLGSHIHSEIQEAAKQINDARDQWGRSGTTSVAKLVNGITADTEPSSIDALAVFTDTDEARLKEIAAILSDDPRNQSAATDAAAKRIRTFAETAKSRASSVDDTTMQEFEEAIQLARATARAADAASGPERLVDELPWGDNEMWRQLWRAAKKYSEEVAYKSKTFPVTESDARCVLCQQPLLPEATDRYARFNKFVANETRKEAETAKAKVAELKRDVDALRTLITEAETIRADLDRDLPEQFADVHSFANAVDTRIQHAQTCLAEGTWVDAPSMPTSPCPMLFALADQLDERATEQEAAAALAKEQALKSEENELADKKWLKANVPEVKAQIDRHILLAALKRCQGDCGSLPVSTKAKKLDKQYVTDSLRAAFTAECKTLGLKTIPVSMETLRVSKGIGQVGVVIQGAVSTKVHDIASEGEHRCIALAAFLAELSQASHKSTLVFDDPVSSLDHKRREGIARRLVDEAKHRQVIVFTHDLAFLCDLESATPGGRKSIHCQHVEWRAQSPGNVADGLIRDAKSVAQQLQDLRVRIGLADKIHSEGLESEYKSAVGPVIDDLRALCERVIEDVLLADVIKRHASHLKVGNVHGVAKVKPDQWLSVKRVWSECSAVTPAHANTKSGPHNTPDPDRLKEWLEALDSTVTSVKQTRKAGAHAN